MKTVDQPEWIVRWIEENVVAMEQPDGNETRLHRGLLPEDVEPGDRFRVVAQVDRRTPERAPVRVCGLPGVRRG